MDECLGQRDANITWTPKKAVVSRYWPVPVVTISHCVCITLVNLSHFVFTEDRDTSNEVLHHTVAKPTTVKNPQSPNRSEYIEIVLTEVATTVLTARPCDWRTSIGAPVKSGGSQQHQGNDGNGAWHGETTAVFLSKDVCNSIDSLCPIVFNDINFIGII